LFKIRHSQQQGNLLKTILADISEMQ